MHLILRFGASKDNLIALDGAQKLAMAGVGSLEGATSALITSMKSYGVEVHRADEVAASMFLGIKNGVITIDGMAKAINDVSSMAKEMGLSINDTIYTISALTAAGLRAEQTGTAMRGFFTAVLQGNASMNEELGKVGLSTQWMIDLMGQEGGYVDMLRRLKTELDNGNISLQNMYANTEQFTFMTKILSEEGLASLEEQLGKDTEKMQYFDKATRDATDNAQDQWNMLKNNLQIILLKIGEAIYDHIEDDLKAWIEWFQDPKNIQSIQDFATGVVDAFKPILDAMGVIIKQTDATFKALGMIVEYNPQNPRSWFKKGKGLFENVWEQLHTSKEEYAGLQTGRKLLAIHQSGVIQDEIAGVREGLEERALGMHAISKKVISDRNRKQVESALRGMKGGTGGGATGRTKKTPETFADKYAEQQKKNAVRAEIESLGASGSLSGMGYEQRMALAQQIASRHGLDAQDFSGVSGFAGDIQRAGDGYDREQERLLRERERERERMVKERASALEKINKSKATTRTPSRATRTSGVSYTPSVSRSYGSVSGGGVVAGGGGTVVNIYVEGAVVANQDQLAKLIDDVLTNRIMGTTKLPIGISQP